MWLSLSYRYPHSESIATYLITLALRKIVQLSTTLGFPCINGINQEIPIIQFPLEWHLAFAFLIKILELVGNKFIKV